MSDPSNLADKSCEPCQSSMPALASGQLKKLQSVLHSDWAVDANGTSLSRRLVFKGYAKAVYHANLAAWLADQEGHHADVTFGWGYCTVTFTTHEAGGLTEIDFICAAKFDRMLAPG